MSVIDKYRFANEEKMEMIEKTFLIIKHGAFPQKIKPIKVRSLNFYCAISRKLIKPGEYAYPCSENPVVIKETGTSRALVREVIRSGDQYLEAGCFFMPAPTFEQCADIPGLEKFRKDATHIDYKIVAEKALLLNAKN